MYKITFGVIMIDVADINSLLTVSVLVVFFIVATILMRIIAWKQDKKADKTERDQKFDEKFRGLYKSEMSKVTLKK